MGFLVCKSEDPGFRPPAYDDPVYSKNDKYINFTWIQPGKCEQKIYSELSWQTQKIIESLYVRDFECIKYLWEVLQRDLKLRYWSLDRGRSVLGEAQERYIELLDHFLEELPRGLKDVKWNIYKYTSLQDWYNKQKWPKPTKKQHDEAIAAAGRDGQIDIGGNQARRPGANESSTN